MSIASMTGFSRRDGMTGDLAWAFELRSVNARALDLRVRVPQGFEALDGVIRADLPKRFARGSFTVNLSVTGEVRRPRYVINAAFLKQVLAEADAAIRALGLEGVVGPPRLDGLMALRGVIEMEEPAASEVDASRTLLDEALKAGFERALTALAESRLEEGMRLAAVMAGHLDAIAALVSQARSLAATQPEALTRKLKSQIDQLLGQLPQLSEERLAQEAAILIARGDVREELDRLDAHVAQARELLAAGGPVGRRLDFLAQEFNREANTLCSKSQDMELTRVGLALKAAVEQMREQVQNIE